MLVVVFWNLLNNSPQSPTSHHNVPQPAVICQEKCFVKCMNLYYRLAFNMKPLFNTLKERLVREMIIVGESGESLSENDQSDCKYLNKM